MHALWPIIYIYYCIWWKKSTWMCSAIIIIFHAWLDLSHLFNIFKENWYMKYKLLVVVVSWNEKKVCIHNKIIKT